MVGGRGVPISVRTLRWFLQSPWAQMGKGVLQQLPLHAGRLYHRLKHGDGRSSEGDNPRDGPPHVTLTHGGATVLASDRENARHRDM